MWSDCDMKPSEYITYDAMGLAELVRKKKVSASELVNAALARADALNTELNAIVVRRDEAVRAEAAEDLDGPFAGVQFLVKDMDGVLADEPNTSSSRSLVDWRPATDSELFARYKDAGLLVIGKTNTPEFGITGVTESELRGPCHNPWDLKYTCWSSSGGSAATFAARLCPSAHSGAPGPSMRIHAPPC